MNPVSAVAVAFFLVIYGLTATALVVASPHVLGVIAIIAGIVVLVDTFWHWWTR